jgi:hypothetical protein
LIKTGNVTYLQWLSTVVQVEPVIRPVGWGDLAFLLYATEWTLLLSAFSFLGGACSVCLSL